MATDTLAVVGDDAKTEVVLSMVFTCREVHVVVTGSAAFSRGYGIPVRSFRGIGIVAVMAVRTVAYVLWEHDLPIAVHTVAKSIDTVVRSCNHARQFLASMDLVDHLLEIDRVATIGIGRTRIVAGNTLLRFESRPPVQGKVFVTYVTGIRFDDFPGEQAVGCSV